MSDGDSNRLRFLTPDDAPAATRCRRILIPDSEAWLALVSGALVELIRPEHWEQHGTLTPEEAAERAQAMFLDYLNGVCVRIGDIVMNICDEVPDGYLPCDGSIYDGVDYPELYSVIWIGWKLEDGLFQVPDFNGRSPVGAGAGTGLTVRGHGAKFGAESHLLGYTEMFPHNHATEQTNDISVLIPAAGTPTDISGPSFATNTGVTPIFDQTAFPTVPPSTAVPFYVVAR